jgi:CBS domain-containing protein/RNA polymerase-binding transcription factor DksA
MAARVKEWMTADPVTTEPQAPARDALALMVEHDIRHLPVVDARGRVVGVLSIDDLRAALPASAGKGAHPDALAHLELGAGRVGELMSFTPECTTADTPLAEAADRMAELRIGCLPVIESQGGLVGILTETDALRALASEYWSSERRERRPRESELESLVTRMRAERQRLERSLREYRETEQRFGAHGREEPLDFSERAADASESEHAGLLRDLAERRLGGLDRALERAEAGRLHFCEHCGRRIPLARLRALPHTTLCIACAHTSER